jgi:hypothetical protein
MSMSNLHNFDHHQAPADLFGTQRAHNVVLRRNVECLEARSRLEDLNATWPPRTRGKLLHAAGACDCDRVPSPITANSAWRVVGKRCKATAAPKARLVRKDSKPTLFVSSRMRDELRTARDCDGWWAYRGLPSELRAYGTLGGR